MAKGFPWWHVTAALGEDKSTTPHAALTTLVGKSSKRGRRVPNAKLRLDGRVREIGLKTLHNSRRPRLACAGLLPPHLFQHPFPNTSRPKDESPEWSVCAVQHSSFVATPYLALYRDTSNEHCNRYCLQTMHTEMQQSEDCSIKVHHQLLSMRLWCAELHCNKPSGVPLQQTPATSPATLLSHGPVSSLLLNPTIVVASMFVLQSDWPSCRGALPDKACEQRQNTVPSQGRCAEYDQKALISTLLSWPLIRRRYLIRYQRTTR